MVSEGMRRATIATFAMLLAGCEGAELSSVKSNCARPADFHSFSSVYWTRQRGIEPLLNRIGLEGRAGAPTWNGVPLGGLEDTSSWTVLDKHLDQTSRLIPQPNVTLDFDRGVSCSAVNRTRALMRKRLQCAISDKCFQGSPLSHAVN